MAVFPAYRQFVKEGRDVPAWDGLRGIPGTQYRAATSRRPHLSASSQMPADITGWRGFLKGSSCYLEERRLHTRTARTLESEALIHQIELSIGRVVHPQKRWPKRGS